jgi:hypothetical protein
MTQPSVNVQIAPESVPSLPSWFGEVVLLAHMLSRFGLWKAREEHVRLARARFGRYEEIDVVAVLLGSAVSGEPTLEAFSARLTPFPMPFWPSSAEPPCRILPPSAVFWQPSISHVWRRDEPCFKRIWWHARHKRLFLAECGIGWGSTGSSSMWMEPSRPLVNDPCFLVKSVPLPIVVWTTCVRKAIVDGNEETWDERAPRFSRLTRSTGWAPFLVQETATIELNCDTPSRPSSAP